MRPALFRSLSGRLLLASLLALPLCLGTAAWYLERAHRQALDAAMAETLHLQVLALLAQVEFEDELNLPLDLLEPRLMQPNSGLYAMVSDVRGETLWLSPSAVLLPDPIVELAQGIPLLAPGGRFTDEVEGLLRHAYQVLWETAGGEVVPLRFLVAGSTVARDADLQVFRRSLWLWLGGTLVLLLLSQWLVFRWGLLPLRRLTDDIARIEGGEATELEGPWPREVQPLADNLQRLLRGELQRRTRLRNTLSDLAHSLKTPLAVLRSADPHADDHQKLQREQLDRMEAVIGWHLQRAAGGSQRPLQRVDVAPVLRRLRSTLLKVYAERSLILEIDCPESLRFRGDERDFMELLGNLLDNACKYSRGEVRVSAEDAESMLTVLVEDDGEGISPELRDALLNRGARADTRREGQGIGLSVVLEIVRAHRGSLSLEDSVLGGAAVRVTLPD